jgi:hypothetical protein
LKRVLIIGTFILGVLISGYLGYSVGVLKMEKLYQSPNEEHRNNDLVVKNDIKYWIGVPRPSTETIIHNGKFYAPVEYIARSMGLPFRYQKEDNWMILGPDIREQMAKEHFIVTGTTQFIGVRTTLDQVKQILGNPLSSKKYRNECSSNDEMVNLYKDAEILFIYDETDKKYFLSDITILSGNIATEKGINIGATVEDIRKNYGEISDYPGWEYEKVAEGFSGDGLIRYGIKESFWFQLKDGKVIRFGIRYPHC